MMLILEIVVAYALSARLFVTRLKYEKRNGTWEHLGVGRPLPVRKFPFALN